MRFRIEKYGKIYKAADMQTLTLKHHLLLGEQTAEMGRRIDIGDVLSMAERLEKVEPKDRIKHPDMMLLIAVLIWAGRVSAGDDVSFAEAIDFPIVNIEWLPDLEDRQPPGPTKAARSRQGSARAASRGGVGRPSSRKG